jgi:hypothetical protein
MRLLAIRLASGLAGLEQWARPQDGERDQRRWAGPFHMLHLRAQHSCDIGYPSLSRIHAGWCVAAYMLCPEKVSIS